MQFLFLVLSALMACGKVTEDPKKIIYKFDTSAVAPSARIFLVAGSSASANFAQEVVDQRHYWLAQGYANNEIACYYTPPRDDYAHFARLASELAHCRLANVAQIEVDLAEANHSALPLYFYITSHGSPPYQKWPLARGLSAEQIDKAHRIFTIRGWSDVFTIDVEGAFGPDRQPTIRSEDEAIWRTAEAHPQSSERYLFSPASFAATLKQMPPSQKKYVGLSACLSGSFVDAEIADNLRSVPNITVLTAARKDRSSFGCGTNEHKTFFDEAFFSTLEEFHVHRFDEVDWPSIYRRVVEKVTARESALGYVGAKASLPQFFSN